MVYRSLNFESRWISSVSFSVMILCSSGSNVVAMELDMERLLGEPGGSRFSLEPPFSWITTSKFPFSSLTELVCCVLAPFLSAPLLFNFWREQKQNTKAKMKVSNEATAAAMRTSVIGKSDPDPKVTTS